MRPLAPQSPYVGREIALATKHGKEDAFGRPFRVCFGARITLAQTFDTDCLGTFSGERERTADALTTVREKATQAMNMTGLTAGLASEGSFGPHPEVPFLALATEQVILIDRALGIEVLERSATERTNYGIRVLRDLDDPKTHRFLERVRFPSHAVLVRPNQRPVLHPIFKGIRTHAELSAAVAKCAAASEDGQARIETDMRAHLNPTRMRHIRSLGVRLVRRLATHCPCCNRPGFGLLQIEPGLPCEECGHPTTMVLHEIHGCVACPERRSLPRRDRRNSAPAGLCPICNP